MADSENDVGSIALAAFEVTAAEMTVVFVFPIAGSMVDRRRSSRLITPKTPRFWPEMKTRRGAAGR